MAKAELLRDRRDAARRDGDYGQADEMRRQLVSGGWIVRDYRDGTKIFKDYKHESY